MRSRVERAGGSFKHFGKQNFILTIVCNDHRLNRFTDFMILTDLKSWFIGFYLTFHLTKLLKETPRQAESLS